LVDSWYLHITGIKKPTSFEMGSTIKTKEIRARIYHSSQR
jgi:hypothetical protein